MFAVLAAPYAALLGACCMLYFIVYPVFAYYKDPKGMYDDGVNQELELNLTKAFEGFPI